MAGQGTVFISYASAGVALAAAPMAQSKRIATKATGAGLVIYADASRPVSPDVMVVDYDLRRLRGTPAEQRWCCEARDIQGSFDRVEVNVISHVPKAQLELDLEAAARLQTSATPGVGSWCKRTWPP